jgi:3-hydroxyisobutyrate dehydrogenase-like beta-hydroxyacid dehydrogenase
MAEKIGILGLGLIGSLTAEILMPEGYECAAVRRPSTEGFPETGGKLFDTARELAQWADIVISALPNVEASRTALEGPDGLLAGAHDGLTIIEMNTFPVVEKERVKAQVDETSAQIIDCPISGTQPIIRAGNGVIMMSGDEARCDAMINFMVGANTVALAEGMLFGAQMGLDPQLMIDIVGPSAAGSTVFNMRSGIIKDRAWQPCAGPSKLLWKDLDIVEEQADALGLSAPLLRICNDYYKKIEKAGRLEDECAVVYEILEDEIAKAAE